MASGLPDVAKLLMTSLRRPRRRPQPVGLRWVISSGHGLVAAKSHYAIYAKKGKRKNDVMEWSEPRRVLSRQSQTAR